MPAKINANIGQEAMELIKKYGKPYVEESTRERRGVAEKWDAMFLDHEVGGTKRPRSLELSLQAMQARGFEIDHLPFEPTLIRFAGKVVDKEVAVVKWGLYAEDRRFGIMANYEGYDGAAASPSTMARSTRDHYRFPDELTSAPVLGGQNLAVVAVLLDHVARDLDAFYPDV